MARVLTVLPTTGADLATIAFTIHQPRKLAIGLATKRNLATARC
jgi:hypothetical protein